MMNYNISMNKQNITDRLMCASACIIQALAFYISLNHEAFKSTIIPFPNISNSFSVVATLCTKSIDIFK